MDYLVNLNLNKNELQNAVIQPLAAAPSNGVLGQVYYNSADHLMYQHNGTSWIAVGSVQDVQNAGGTSFVSNGIATIPNASTSAAGLMTTTQVTKLNGIAEGAQVNVVETIKVNGTALTPSSKAVDITAIPLSIVTGADNLKAIEALSGTSGLLKKTATNTWALDTSTYATESYVDTAIANLPEPMIFKGTVGTDGTVTWANLPAAASSNEGYTYKVITAHTAETGKPAAEVGDTIVSTGSEWTVIPSGDEPSGTVTNIATGTGLTGGPITSTGTISHSDIETTAAVSTAALVKITTDGIGHIQTTNSVQKSDLTSIIGDATQSAGGLMSATDKTTLDNLEAASQGAITYTTLTIAQGTTSISASGVASKLITFQAYQGGEAVIVDYDGSDFSVAAAAASAITIKCVVTV